MKRPGQVILLDFPQTGLNKGKRRPALLIAPLPGNYKDWLLCMISTRLHQAISGLDEVIDKNSPDFNLSGLMFPSLIRVTRLAVVSDDMLFGSLGEISSERLKRVRANLSNWIVGNFPDPKEDKKPVPEGSTPMDPGSGIPVAGG